MTTIEKIKKYSPPSLDEMIQRNEKRLEELKTYNKLDIIAFNLIRGFQNQSNYEETISDIEDFLYDLYLAKYDEEHPIEWLSTPPRMLSIVSKMYSDNLKYEN